MDSDSSPHPIAHREYWEPPYIDLPFKLQDRYHRCGNYQGLPNEEYRNGPPICGTCRKIVPWFFHKCVKCETHFIQDFRHPKFCTYYPTCWEHTLELEWEYCVRHRSYLREHDSFFWTIVEPIGLNPRKVVVDLTLGLDELLNYP